MAVVVDENLWSCGVVDSRLEAIPGGEPRKKPLKLIRVVKHPQIEHNLVQLRT
jgi:hypothetical protein